MTSFLISLLAMLRGVVRSRAALHLEVLALRHQLHVLQRSQPRRLHLANADRWRWGSRVRLANGSDAHESSTRAAEPASMAGSTHGVPWNNATCGPPDAGIVTRTASHPPALPSPTGPIFELLVAHAPSFTSVRNTWPRPDSSEMISWSGSTTVEYFFGPD